MHDARSTRPCVRLLVAALLSLLCAAALGCSFSYSSDSSSDSSKHSSDSSTSSSASSSPDHGQDHDEKESARFDADVEHYTVAFLEAGGTDESSFLFGLGDLARLHGVSDWESEPRVWEAIGRGLAKSPVGTAERVAYQMAWTNGDAERQSAVAKGLAAPK